MEKCGHRSVIAYSARGYFCSMDVNLTMRISCITFGVDGVGI
jgi:hypothetical protein